MRYLVWHGLGLAFWSLPQLTTLCECGPFRASVWASLGSLNCGAQLTQLPSSTQHQLCPTPHQVFCTVTPNPLSTTNPSTICAAGVGSGVGEGEGREWSGEAKERKVEEELVDNALESPAEELTTLKNKVSVN